MITHETQAFNYLIHRFLQVKGVSHQRISAWFSAGVFVGCIGQVASLMLLFYQLFLAISALTSTTDQIAQDVAIVTPIVPGLTVPAWSIVYIWLSIFVSVAFHELGHAVSAAIHRIQTRSVGVFLSVLLPGAYVRIEHDFSHLKPLQQLQIFFAGVWHNFVSGYLSFVLLTKMSLLL